METLWNIRNLRHEYRVQSAFGRRETVRALDGVNLDIITGETLGIVGESGCGKTTLGKVILRLVEPTSGTIRFRGADITKLPERDLRPLRRRFQIVFQHPYRSLNPRIPVSVAVMEGVDPSFSVYQKREEAARLLSSTGISPERMDRLPHQFSGGERQRIAIARSLATSPEFLVCDEPTSNLDLSIQAQILNLFVHLKREFNLTYLFISHDLKVIGFMADRVAVMYLGNIVELGAASDVIATPLHPYTRLLIASSTFAKPPETGDRPEPHRETGCPFADHCPNVIDDCLLTKPELHEIAPGHSVACALHKHDEKR